MVQGLDPSGMPECQATPKPWQEAFASGADSCRPADDAVTVAVVGPAVAVAVTVLGVLPVAHTQVSMPTRVAPRVPTLGLVSTVGVGSLIAFQAARARVAPSTGTRGGCWPAGTNIDLGLLFTLKKLYMIQPKVSLSGARSFLQLTKYQLPSSWPCFFQSGKSLAPT